MRSALSKLLKVSISSRIAILFSLTFASGLLIAFLVTYIQLEYSLESSSKEVISAKLGEVSAVLATAGVKGLKDFLLEENNRILNAPFMVRVMNASGETLYFKPSVQDKQFDFDEGLKIQSLPEKNLGWHALSALNDEDKFDILTEKAGPSLFLQIGKSSEDREEILDRILTVFFGMGGLLIIFGGGLGLWYSRKSLAPIRDLLSTMAVVEKGNLSQRVPLSKPEDELQELGQTFNRMISRIEILIRVMRESIDNVAHDIRTPLTRIRAVAEDALVSAHNDSLKEALEDCAEAATGISELVDQLLSISEAEAGTLNLQYENCDVRSLVEEVLDIYELVLLEKNIRVWIDSGSESLTWKLDRKRIKQAVGNLLDNAIKFSPQDSEIEIHIRASGETLEISALDRGVGIPEAEAERIWDRLYRTDKSRSTKGSGLGLSIVKSVVVAHRGSVASEPRAGGGTKFSLVLPKQI